MFWHKKHAIDLPEYPLDTDIIMSGDEIKSLAKTSGMTAIRLVRVHPSSRLSLKETLKTSDEIFEKVAYDAGATVVKHLWGICRTPEGILQVPGYPLSNDLLPPGYNLVAEVDVINNIVPMPNDKLTAIRGAISRHRREGYLGHRWIDADDSQFITAATTSPGQPEAFLVDIEPFVVIH